MVIGFALVMRVQIAYARFWEGATMLRQCTVKLTSAVLQVLTFDEVGKKAWEDSGLEFRMEIVHYASLFHALVLLDVRGDDMLTKELALNKADTFLFALKPKGQQAVAAPTPMKRASVAAVRCSKADLNGSGRQTSPSSTRRYSRGVTAATENSATRSSRGTGRVTDGAAAASDRSSGRYSTNNSLREDDVRRGVPVPLRVILSARSLLMQDDTSASFNTFVAIDALEAGREGRVEPQPNLFSTETFVSLSEYIWTTIFLQHSSGSLSKLAVTNGFDVVGGVSQEELEMLSATPSADRSYLVLSWILRMSAPRRNHRKSNARGRSTLCACTRAALGGAPPPDHA